MKIEKEFSDINVTPLVDVVLVLLIIFMITAPLLFSGLKIQLPEANATPIPPQENPIVLMVDKDGKVYFEEKEIPLLELKKRLPLWLERAKVEGVYIKADERASYGSVLKVLDLLNQLGVTSVALVTRETK